MKTVLPINEWSPQPGIFFSCGKGHTPTYGFVYTFPYVLAGNLPRRTQRNIFYDYRNLNFCYFLGKTVQGVKELSSFRFYESSNLRPSCYCHIFCQRRYFCSNSIEYFSTSQNLGSTLCFGVSIV